VSMTGMRCIIVSLGGDVALCQWEEMCRCVSGMRCVIVSVTGRRCVVVSLGGDVSLYRWEEMCRCVTGRCVIVSMTGRRCVIVSLGGDVALCHWEEMCRCVTGRCVILSLRGDVSLCHGPGYREVIDQTARLVLTSCICKFVSVLNDRTADQFSFYRRSSTLACGGIACKVRFREGGNDLWECVGYGSN